MLQGSFFDILHSDKDRYTIRFNASHPIFSGHFPGHPIVPGACVVQIVEELAMQTYGCPIRFTEICDLKLRQPITPDQEITISISKTAETSCKVLCADSKKEPQLIISLNITKYDQTRNY